jgi:large subunit ribosomal protein L30
MSGQPTATIKIKLVRSTIGYPEAQRQVVRGLGLRKPNSEVIRPRTPEILGMINKIPHLVEVEVVENK